MTHLSKDGIYYLSNDAFPNNINTNLHLMLIGFLTIHYKFIHTYRNIPKTKISTWFQARGRSLLNLD
jgi:hypothetical protein